MLLKYFYDEKLAHASYLVGCQKCGEAIVIDPSRDVSKYLQAAKVEGVKITAVTETHIHADFLSGARELAATADATLYLSAEGGPDWSYQYVDAYKHVPVHDGTKFSVGNIRFEVMHTPGHTPEHISFIVTDGGSNAPLPMGIFSGDFVFVGDIGRPDLLEKAAGVAGSSADMARRMFKSLQRFKQLPDSLQLWPAHGAGSACGKSLGAIPSSTVGYEKMVNWALNEEDEDRFVETLTSGQPEPPTYFAMMKKLNKEGPGLLSEVARPQRASESISTLQEWLKSGVVVDARPASAFAKAHFARVINIPLNKSFPTWAGWLLSYDRPIYVLCEEDQVDAVVHDLQSIGLDQVAATMSPAVVGRLPDADVRVHSYTEVRPEQVVKAVENGDVYVLDVRNSAEWSEGHIAQAHHVMLGTLAARLSEVPKDKTILVHCRSGARSAIAASILQAGGVMDVQNMLGGYDEWLRTGQPVTV